MKVKDYVKTLKRGKHKFNTVEVHLKGSKCYVEEKEFTIERNKNSYFIIAGGVERITICVSYAQDSRLDSCSCNQWR